MKVQKMMAVALLALFLLVQGSVPVWAGDGPEKKDTKPDKEQSVKEDFKDIGRAVKKDSQAAGHEIKEEFKEIGAEVKGMFKK